MNLQGSITERQNSIYQLYQKIEDRFSENSLIRALWSDMAHDISQQISSMKALPSSFWNQLKKDPDSQLEEAVRQSVIQSIEKTEVASLRRCFELSLHAEEAMILKIYAPIIRILRKHWTGAALDFYIMVKSHVARIVRVTESFSGDPILTQRAHLLLQGFEKEAQEPQVEAKPILHKAAKLPAEAKSSSGSSKKAGEKAKKGSKSAPLLTKHAKPHHARTKPLVKKVELPRRRARR